MKWFEWCRWFPKINKIRSCSKTCIKTNVLVPVSEWTRMQVNVFCWKASTQQSCHLHCTTAAALQPECVCVCVHVLAMSTICLSITQSQDVWSKRSAASLDVVVRLGARPAHRVCRLFFCARYQLMGHLSAAWWHALPAETNRIVVHVMTKLQLRRNGRPVMCTVCLSWMQQVLFPHSLVWCVVMGTSEPPFASHMKLCKTLTYFYIQGRSVLLLLFQWLMFTLNASAVSNNEASACAVNLRLLLKLKLISFFLLLELHDVITG